MIKKIKPFLKWVGGKSKLLNQIDSKIPYSTTDSFSYAEPFVGGGAVLFHMLSKYPNLKSATINDINVDLINTYRVIKSNVHALITILSNFEKEFHNLINEDATDYYLTKRTLFNTRSSNMLTQSALFIFLNKTCFNGLYRVNRKNIFNVPKGSNTRPCICDESNLLLVSQALQKVKILSGDYADTKNHTCEPSLFYFDPPYRPISKTSNFKSYDKSGFDDNAQIRLRDFCDELSTNGHLFILSNSDPKSTNTNDTFFDDIYAAYNIDRVLASRSINSKGSGRGKVTELIITNIHTEP